VGHQPTRRGAGGQTADPALAMNGRGTNHRVTENTEGRHTEKSPDKTELSDSCLTMNEFSVFLVSVFSVTLWFVLYSYVSEHSITPTRIRRRRDEHGRR